MCKVCVLQTVCTVLYVLTVGDIPPCAEEQLPVPENSSVTCSKIEDGLKCELKCHPMFKVSSSEDVSPQYCHDGLWDFQRDKIEIPGCQRELACVSLFNLYTAYYIMQLHVYTLYLSYL